jgi:Kef-type K+ transport system membrane component KefB/nucleotide-binding universal stress UspA family protein
MARERRIPVDATFGSASHDEVLQLVIQIAILLGTARLLGSLARRLGQPSVVGEIMAGVLLGPSLLSGLVPAVGQWILPQTAIQGHLLEVVGLIGVTLLLIVTGFETDLGLIRRRVGVAFGISAGGLSVTFASGFVLGNWLPDDLLVDPEQRTLFALFVATALSIAAIPVLAKVLIDLDVMRREIGQTMLATAMIDDITGWTMLGLVTALAAAGSLSGAIVAETVGWLVLFVVATATIGRWLVDKSLVFVQDRFHGQDMVLTLVIVLAFGWGAFSQALHLEAVIGAFAIGILFGRLPRLPADTVHKIESMAMGVFAPIFFAIAGLKVDIFSILEPRLLALTALVIGVATFGKVTGAYLGARLISRQAHWPALAYGSGLNARGALEIIIASIGLSLGILSLEMFSIIVVMAVVTSLMAPVALRFCLARVAPQAEEEERLEKQQALKSSFTGSIQRALIPVRPRNDLAGAQTIQAFIADRLATVHGSSSTLLSVSQDASPEMANQYLSRLKLLFDSPVTTRVIITGDDPVAAILGEAQRDYGLLMIGTPAMSDAVDSLFGEVIDDLVKLSPIPTVVVRGDSVEDDWRPSRILVPTNGTSSSRRATDLALVIAGPDDVVTGIHVVTASAGLMRPTFAADITSEMQAVATRLHQRIETDVREATDVESGILEAIERTGADLLVLGTSVRAGSTRLHLGPRVEYLARHAPCPVVIINA